ncbi:trehalose-phosphatase [Mycobacterium heckeshornense]|uniref:Trehalose 6-phosphate phosphatase n=1 Tax=Mycobacterium heckeshornense TaxID=110505 RepID=A0A2G8BIS3_9MYCO|nr:trehalose-phosphatase [Mycobacterium heckeshornense]KMV20757.1 trehalose phosphatase [Mycobacterium heckeshornense]MCV7034212.1 trehalose-phosphatase [Mycobacterium heckeshornense]PIJ37582.1 trehalose-phosphatase [Mycobacterium heckeshornense]BCO37459.1 trehalose-phosphate phosphatase [Mycobacterium heckeshornense]
MPVIIDPRRHDAVLFDLDNLATDAMAALRRRLGDVGLRAGDVAGPPEATTFVDAADRLGARPGRCVVVAATGPAVAAARAGGFALVVGVGADADELRRNGADAVVTGLGEVRVRAGDRRMSELPDGLQALSVVAARPPVVFFDFDGTLSDIVDNPDAAQLTAGAAEALRLLTAQCPVAVLSGRDLADVRQRIGLAGIWYAGSHGFELTAPDGEHHQNDEAATAIPVLRRAAAELGAQLDDLSGVVVEHKRFGVAVHYRNAARDRVGDVLAAVRAAGRRNALRVTTGREVIELRPDVDWDKGKTLHWVLGHIREAAPGQLLPIYLGDDITDEDAFDAVRGDGIAIVVRHGEDGDRPTAAHYGLDSPRQVVQFTEQLARHIRASAETSDQDRS